MTKENITVAFISLVCFAVFAISFVSGSRKASAKRLNCRAFEYQEDAQKVFDRNPNLYAALDRGGKKGTACEGLPHR